MLRDNYIFNRSYSSVFLPCIFCGQFNHFSRECIYFHIFPNRDRLTSKMVASNKQERKAGYPRTKKRTSKALIRYYLYFLGSFLIKNLFSQFLFF